MCHDNDSKNGNKMLKFVLIALISIVPVFSSGKGYSDKLRESVERGYQMAEDAQQRERVRLTEIQAIEANRRREKSAKLDLIQKIKQLEELRINLANRDAIESGVIARISEGNRADIIAQTERLNINGWFESSLSSRSILIACLEYIKKDRGIIVTDLLSLFRYLQHVTFDNRLEFIKRLTINISDNDRADVLQQILRLSQKGANYRTLFNMIDVMKDDSDRNITVNCLIRLIERCRTLLNVPTNCSELFTRIKDIPALDRVDVINHVLKLTMEDMSKDDLLNLISSMRTTQKDSRDALVENKENQVIPIITEQPRTPRSDVDRMRPYSATNRPILKPLYVK